ncbi:MAG: hypothetical protein JWM37_134 [Candidatus Saccharibacteria bacterium]|nr:hypothetical protein [Candidatus Saccharibacteria bacterium]
MIQFNLLPDVKMQFVKAQRLKHLVTLASVVLSAVALVVLVLAFTTVKVVQKSTLNGLQSEIAENSKKLKDTPNLNKILTVQNQLNTLTDLHDQKVVSSRLFTYIGQVTPTSAKISNLTVDFTANTVTMGGNAPSLDVVNVFTDTLKSTKYKNGDTTANAFSDVVLASFSRDKDSAHYGLTFSFDPKIFQSSENVSLVIPAGVTGDPSNLFQAQGSN